MATDEVVYLTYEDAIFIHIDQMHCAGETRFGVEDRNLILSALARPRHSAVYEDADLVRQAATLYFGLIKNHPWAGGNKRTATALVDAFLISNGFEIVADIPEIIDLVLGIESDRYKVTEIETWLRERVVKLID